MDHDRDAAPSADLDDDITQPLPLAHALARRSRAGSTFVRLADALEVDVSTLSLLLSELLAFHDATPSTLTSAQVWNMRAGLLEIAANVLPRPTRERAHSRLELLLLDLAPAEGAS